MEDCLEGGQARRRRFPVATLPADGDLNGIVDFVLLSNNFGAMVPSPSGERSNGAIYLRSHETSLTHNRSRDHRPALTSAGHESS